jgi:glutamate-5-semialdehyde dehydrogenase
MNAPIEELIQTLGAQARAAARSLATTTADQRKEALCAIADALDAAAPAIADANAKDVEAAQTRGLSGAMLDRLRLTPSRMAAMIQGVREVAQLGDPVGEILREWTRPNGLRLIKRRVPIGVIGIIYESRPNVTVDAAVLCLKTANATLLRGGSEAFHSNTALAAAMAQGLEKIGLPAHAIQCIPTTDREAVSALCRANQHVDLLIPRGGHALIERVVSEARMPVIKHYNGICHLFVHHEANLQMAEALLLNGKCQRPGVCNALETLLIDASAAERLLPPLAAKLAAAGVQLRGCPAARALVPSITPATEEDWTTEYLDLIISVKVVKNLDDAIGHIETYGSHHSDAIVTENPEVARQFLERVDSAAVFWNASTRFSDGGEFGFGAEIGISTDKLHARGPMGLEELTSYKYQVMGTGQVRG